MVRLAGELLLKLADALNPVIHGQILNETYSEIAGDLIRLGALKPDGPVTFGLTNTECDIAYSEFQWDSTRQAYGRFDPTDGFVEADRGGRNLYRLDMLWWLIWISQSLDLVNSSRPTEVVRGMAWDIGDIWISRQRKVPIVFARRLFASEESKDLDKALRQRAGRGGGLILTSTDSPLEERIGSYAVTPMRRTLTNDADFFAIDRQLLMSPLLDPAPVTAGSGFLALSPDGRKLVIHGSVTLTFKANSHICIISKLVDGHRESKRFSARELLDYAPSSAKTLRQAFGNQRWAELEPYLKSENGLWGFDP